MTDDKLMSDEQMARSFERTRDFWRFYLKYLRDFQDWYFDRQDSDDGSNGR